MVPDDIETLPQTPGLAPRPALPAAAGWRGGGARFGLIRMSLLAFLVGAVTGLGAFVFRELIGLVHNLFFLKTFAFSYDSSLFTAANPWGPLVILVPVAGAIGVTFIVSKFAPEAKGHGVPEVMDAIYYKEGVIRPVVAVAKSLASALAIGSGAAVGREGPIIQIGSALGSTLGQLIAMSPGQRITLVAAGAGAGIAATFNTPIGGVLFAIELMLPEVSVNTFLPVAVSTGTATFIGRLFFGPQPAFQVPTDRPAAGYARWRRAGPAALPSTRRAVRAGRGGLYPRAAPGRGSVRPYPGRLSAPRLWHAAGRGADLRPLSRFRALFRRRRRLRHDPGDPDRPIDGRRRCWRCCSCASWRQPRSAWARVRRAASFHPRYIMGATLGAAFAGLISAAAPGAPVNLPAFAMVGMGAMVGGGTGAAMTAVTMIFEMTRDYDIVLPMILAVAVALGVRRLLSRENIYTLKLVRRGHPIPKALQANMFLVRPASEVMERDFLTVPADTGFGAFLQRPDHQGRMRHVVVTRNDHIAGVLRINTGLGHGTADIGTGVTLGDVATHNFTLVRAEDVTFDVITRMWRRHAVMAIVVGSSAKRRFHSPRPSEVVGVITKEHVADAVAASIQVYPR